MIIKYTYTSPITHTIPICFIHITLSHGVLCFNNIPTLIRLGISSMITMNSLWTLLLVQLGPVSFGSSLFQSYKCLDGIFVFQNNNELYIKMPMYKTQNLHSIDIKRDTLHVS